jgi:hypothetical protein
MPAADAEPAATLPAASLEVNSAQKDEAVAATPARAASKRLSIPWGQVGSWAALILLVTAIGWAAIQYRQIIANLWPQSASLYAALGMPVNVRGIALVNVAYQQDFEDGQPVLAVTGKVVNISDKEMVVPGIRVVLTDEEKHELYHWTFDPGVPSLKAGAESSFVTRLSSPPPEARNLNIRFLDIGESQ